MSTISKMNRSDSDREIGDAPRHCRSCGRRMEPRRRWEGNFEVVRYCSRACRARGVRAVDRKLEDAIISLLGERARGDSICPSEAARRVDDNGWRALMEPARRAARRLVHAGEVEILQRNRPVDPSDFRGPVRIRRRSEVTRSMHEPDWRGRADARRCTAGAASGAQADLDDTSSTRGNPNAAEMGSSASAAKRS